MQLIFASKNSFLPRRIAAETSRPDPRPDLPWEQACKALDEIGFAGWATVAVGGGGLKRLTQVREQMQEAFAL